MSDWRKEHVLIVDALRRRKTCRCFWLFVSKEHDRYKVTPACGRPCRELDDVLHRLNAA